MALRDYYRCKKCDAKIAYGPDRPDEDWEPFLLCRECIASLEAALESQQKDVSPEEALYLWCADDRVIDFANKVIRARKARLTPILQKG